MKKRKKLLPAVLCLIVLLSAVLSCSKQADETETDLPSSAEEVPTVIEKPDLTETEELNIYIEDQNRSRMKVAIRAFEELYPDVSLHTEELGQDELTARMRVEIPAGDGPDAIWCADTYLPDVYKSMASGVFTDLVPYFRTDEDFNCDDYIPATWTSGVIRNKQYVVPLQFELRFLLTTEELLAENGISREGLDTYDGFLDACLTFHQNNPDKELFDYGANTHFYKSLLLYTGIRFLEPDNETFSVEPEQFKHLLDVAKAWYPGNSTEFRLENGGWAGLLERNMFFMEQLPNPLSLVVKAGSLFISNETPVLVSAKSPDEKDLAQGFDFMAIPTGSKNKLNAYRFIKLTLSYDYQSDKTSMLTITPVMKEAIENDLTSSLDRYIKPLDREDTEEFYQYLHDEITNKIDSIDEIDFYRTYLRNSALDILMPYIEGETSFDAAYQKFMNLLTIYKDE